MVSHIRIHLTLTFQQVKLVYMIELERIGNNALVIVLPCLQQKKWWQTLLYDELIIGV